MQQTHEFLEKMARTTDKDVQRQQHIGDFYDHFHTIFSKLWQHFLPCLPLLPIRHGHIATNCPFFTLFLQGNKTGQDKNDWRRRRRRERLTSSIISSLQLNAPMMRGREW